MQTLKGDFTTTLEVKQSKFIAHLIPYELYKTTLKQLKIQHPKARHFVTAYRYLNKYSQVVEHSSDDGEPKGTSGKPSLMVLQGEELVNVAVVVVRYFGGTKLGTGGLVRAYSDAVNLVVNEANLIEYREENTQTIEIKYEDIRLIDYEIKADNITIVEKKFDTSVVYTIKGVKESLENFLAKVARIVTLR